MSFIHPLSDVQSKNIGADTTIWQFVVILPGAQIGNQVNVCSGSFIENDVIIGDRVTIKSGVYLWDGLRVEDDVFIGPNVTFTNDKLPRSKVKPLQFLETRIEKGASIGGGAVILPGITIGRGAMIGAGAIVTKSVPPYAIITNTPARITNYINNNQLNIKPSEQIGFTEIDNEQPHSIPLNVGEVTLHRLKRVRDLRGDLSVGEFTREIPFTPKRYFIVFDVPSEKTRGEHAHHKCHQFIVCIKGSCAVVVDNGKNRREVKLDSPELGLYLPPMIWGIQYKYSKDAVLLVFTSDFYDSADYIRDYSEFLNLVNTN